MKDLFIKEKEDLIEDLKGLQRHCAIRKVNEMVKRARFLWFFWFLSFFFSLY